MNDVCEEICDDLAAKLNAAQEEDESSEEENPFSLFFVARNVEDPNGELDKEPDQIRVLLWPHAETAVKIGRGGEAKETYSIAMLVLRKVSNTIRRRDIAGLDRTIRLWIRRRRIAGRVWSTEEGTKFDLEHMRDFKRVECSTIITFSGTA